MEKHALRLLALALVAGFGGGRPAHQENSTGGRAGAAEQTLWGEQLAWDCVPDYSWSYWRWAWQPCAWLDPGHVQHAVAALGTRPRARGQEPAGLDSHVGTP